MSVLVCCVNTVFYLQCCNLQCITCSVLLAVFYVAVCYLKCVTCSVLLAVCYLRCVHCNVLLAVRYLRCVTVMLHSVFTQLLTINVVHALLLLLLHSVVS